MRISYPASIVTGGLRTKWASLPKPVAVSLCLVLIFIVGLLDYFSGHEIHITAFYLIPICWASWTLGRNGGLWMASVSVLVWLIAEISTGYPYVHWGIPYWNALMLLALYVVVVFLLSAFKSAQFHLEETVQLRTAALRAEMAERKRVELAKLQAERLAVVGTMAAEVAHEVRNPLASITLNLDLVRKEFEKLANGREDLIGEGCILVGEMREEVRRIQRVVEDYLQFARLPKPQTASVQLNDVLAQKLAFLDAELRRAKVKLRTHFDPALKNADVDIEQLWQAILNLVRNSVEAMPDGGELTVSTWQQCKQLSLRVADNGKGMTGSQLRQVFKPFFTTKTRGTGLGLTLVQQIVTEHGGHVECESIPNQGTTFTIVLPLEEKNGQHPH